MRLKFFHQVPLNPTHRIIYEIVGDIITAMYPDGSSDQFDFTGLPDGELFTDDVETHLEPTPILEAKKVDGILSVFLLNYIGTETPEEDLQLGWIDHTEYIPPKDDELEEEELTPEGRSIEMEGWGYYGEDEVAEEK